jgi:iron complex outermembrane receptor protein
MSLFRRFVIAALLLALPLSATADDPSPETIRLYAQAQQALAAGDLQPAVAAARALSERGDAAIRALAARVAAATTLDEARQQFRALSASATNWTLPAGYVLVRCHETETLWVQAEGTIANPFDGSNCGSVIDTRFHEQMTVRGYLNTYNDGETLSATRISASLMEIPLSVTPLTRDLMTDQNVTDVDDVMHNAPTVTPVLGLLRPNFYLMRGFYVLNYRDGVRAPIDGTITLDPAAIERIEILKGPSSILYGKGDPGGIINFLSRRPARTTSGSVNLSVGSAGVRRGSFDITGTLTESIAGRLIVSSDNSDSFRDEVTTQNLYVNPSLTFAFGPKTSLWLTGEYTRNDTVPDQGIFVRFGGEIPDMSTRERFYGNTGDSSIINGQRIQGEFETQMTPNWTLRAIVGREVYDQEKLVWTFQLLDSGPTGYLGAIPPDQLFQAQFNESPERHHNTARLESAFTFDAGTTKHQLVASADYREDVENLQTDILDHRLLNYVNGTVSTSLLNIPFGQGLFFQEHTRVEATGRDVGVAVQDLVELTPRLNLLAGVRFENNTITSRRTGFQQVFGILGGPVVPLDSAPDDSKTDNVSPRVGLLFKVTPNLSVYGSYLTAFFSPPPGALTLEGNPLDPESSSQREVGLKASLFDNRLLFTTSIYDIDKDDAFVFFPTHADNAGLEESRGFELDLTGALTNEINVMVGYSHTDMEFARGEERLIGKTRPGVPEHAFNVWGVYNAPAGPLNGFAAGLGAYYISKVWISYTNSGELPAYTTVDGMLAYRWGNWKAQMNLQNLNNAEGYSPSGGFAAGNDPNLTPGMAMPIGPRRVTFNLAYGF